MKKPLTTLFVIIIITLIMGLGFRIALALNYIDFSGADTALHGACGICQYGFGPKVAFSAWSEPTEFLSLDRVPDFAILNYS